jgi:carbon-monoxide dehydrogenase medium subunit
VVGAVAVVRLESGRIADARLVFTGVSDTPVRATAAESMLVGAEPTDEVFTEAAREASKDLSPPADLHGTSAYRRHLAGVLAHRTLSVAAQRAWEAA